MFTKGVVNRIEINGEHYGFQEILEALMNAWAFSIGVKLGNI